MCLQVPSSVPTPAPSPAPTVSYERKIQCDVRKQQTCATRTRGDSCTDWQLECFYVQCPAGVEATGRDSLGRCFRESPHEEDHRTFSNLDFGRPLSGWHESPGAGLASGPNARNDMYNPLKPDRLSRFEPQPSEGAQGPFEDYVQNTLHWTTLNELASSGAAQKGA